MSWEDDRREFTCPCGAGTVIVCSGNVSDDWNGSDFRAELVERRVACEKCPHTETTIVEAIRLDEARGAAHRRNKEGTQQSAWRAQLHSLSDPIADHAKAWMAIKTRLGGHRAWVRDMTSKEFVSLASRSGRVEAIRIIATRICPTIFDLDLSKPTNARG